MVISTRCFCIVARIQAVFLSLIPDTASVLHTACKYIRLLWAFCKEIGKAVAALLSSESFLQTGYKMPASKQQHSKARSKHPPQEAGFIM